MPIVLDTLLYVAWIPGTTEDVWPAGPGYAQVHHDNQ
jgi:hypothetical protein